VSRRVCKRTEVGLPIVDCSLSDQNFPDGFIDETLRTLAVLFPRNDREFRRWLVKQVLDRLLDSGILRCGKAWAQDQQFEKFHF
jgi:hypothetical protein